MRSFVFLVFKLISRAFTCPLVGTQASLLGILQLPEYFKNSGDCLIPKGSVLLHTWETTKKSDQFSGREFPSFCCNYFVLSNICHC